METEKVSEGLLSVFQILEKTRGQPGITGHYQLTSQDLRNLRLVCKSWRNTVNYFASHHPALGNLFMKRGDDYVNYARLLACALPVVVNVQHPRKITSILKHLENNIPSCSLLSSKHIVLKGLTSFGGHDKKDDLTEEEYPILSLLEKVGSSIWHFAVDNEKDQFYSRDDIINWHHAVVKCLHLLPNLRSLVIFQAINSCNVREPSQLSVPHFPHLTVIQLVRASENVYKSLFFTNPHIEKLTMHLCGTSRSTVPQRSFHQFVDFASLREFSLGVYFVDNFGCEWDFLRRVRLPVTKLCLSNQPVSPKRLLKRSTRFADSLTHLYVEKLKRPISEIAPLKQIFPNLVHVELPEEL